MFTCELFLCDKFDPFAADGGFMVRQKKREAAFPFSSLSRFFVGRLESRTPQQETGKEVPPYMACQKQVFFVV